MFYNYGLLKWRKNVKTWKYLIIWQYINIIQIIRTLLPLRLRPAEHCTLYEWAAVDAVAAQDEAGLEKDSPDHQEKLHLPSVTGYGLTVPDGIIHVLWYQAPDCHWTLSLKSYLIDNNVVHKMKGMIYCQRDSWNSIGCTSFLIHFLDSFPFFFESLYYFLVCMNYMLYVD